MCHIYYVIINVVNKAGGAMKMFWEVLGTKKKLYTGYAVKYVIDKKDGKRYETGKGKLYLKKDHPKNLAENVAGDYSYNARYDFCYGVPSDRKPDRIEKKGFFGGERHIYFSPPPKMLEREYLDWFGLWKIDGLDLYTDLAADYVRDKQTGREYRRGERVLFENEDTSPFPLAEHSDRYEYVLEINAVKGELNTNDYMREIMAMHFLRKR